MTARGINCLVFDWDSDWFVWILIRISIDLFGFRLINRGIIARFRNSRGRYRDSGIYVCDIRNSSFIPHTDFAVDRSQRSTRGAGCIWAGATGPRKLFRLEFHILFSFYFFMCSIFVFNFFMFYFLSSTFFLPFFYFSSWIFVWKSFLQIFYLIIFCWTFLAPKFLFVQKFCTMTFLSKIYWSQNIPVQILRNLSA